MNLDKESPIPIYYQIQKLLQSKIDSGQWTLGTRIPSERELSEQLRVSRMTIRQALAALEQRGVLARRVGWGTFVTEPPITQALNRLTSFTADMLARGKRPGAAFVQREVIQMPPKLAQVFGGNSHGPDEAGDRAVKIERIRLADDEPVALECSYLHFPGCLGLLEDDLSGSLYELIERKYGIVPTRAKQRFSAALSSKRESELLNIKFRSPVLAINRLTYDQDNRLFEYVDSSYRGDRYVFDAELLIPPRSPAVNPGFPME